MTLNNEDQPRLVVDYPDDNVASSPKILQFTPRCEQCHKSLKSCRCDEWVSPCGSCGLPVYGGDRYVMASSSPVCPECLSEAEEWTVSRKAA